jgi:N-acetylglucosamine-6-phosphate deacetylase
MTTGLIENCRVVSRTTIQNDRAVLCQNGRIEAILSESEASACVADARFDAGGRFLAPGLIDLHCHGAMNQAIDSGPEAMARLCRILPRFGVTGFLPTLTPGSADDAAEVKRLADYGRQTYAGTAVLGFFLEGHYLALAGAISNIPHVYSAAIVAAQIAALQPYPVIFGISPELAGIEALLPAMTPGGRPAFITHTQANVARTEQAIALGARHATHFYDVFPYPGEQEPGVRGCGAVEAILASPLSSVDFILDGEHVDPVAVRMALQALGPDRVCLVTDANVNAGLPPGVYDGLGGQSITVAYPGAPARLGPGSSLPGVLSGSGLTMDLAVRNAVAWLGVDLPQAIAMASANPARVLGLDRVKGTLAPGYDADLILLDEQLRVTDCWIGGRHV